MQAPLQVETSLHWRRSKTMAQLTLTLTRLTKAHKGQFGKAFLFLTVILIQIATLAEAGVGDCPFKLS